MPQNAAGDGRPPGGRRLGRVEHERRVQLVAQLLAAGHSRAALIELLGAKLHMSERTLDDYIAEVRRRWAAAGATVVEEARGRCLQRLDDLGIKMEQAKSWAPLVQLERLRGDVLGVRAPFEVAVKQTNAEPRSMTETAIQIGAVLRALIKKAMAGAARGDVDAARALDGLKRHVNAAAEQLRQAPDQGHNL